MANPDNANELYAGTPFRSPLIDAGFKRPGLEMLAFLKSDPEKIVRMRLDETTLEYEPISEINDKLGVFEELRGYGMVIAPISVVLGPSVRDRTPGFVTQYLVTDRIHGKKLRDLDFKGEDAHAKKEIDPLYSTIAQYYWDKLYKDGWLMQDLAWFGSQFVWGRRKGEEIDQMHMVDVGLNLSLLDSERNLEMRDRILFKAVYEVPINTPRNILGSDGLMYDLMAMEHTLEERLSETRGKLRGFVKDFIKKGSLKDYDDNQALIFLQEYLEG